MAPLILACDFGTTSLKAALFHPSNPTAPLRTLEAAYPTSGTTQCAEDWWAGWRRIMSSISPDAKPSIISLTGQMQDLVCTDAAGRAVAPATLYTDTSATREARVLHERLPDWERITGNEQGANSPAAMWMKGVPAGTQRVLFGPAGYIAARLGLGFHVDCTTASTTGLMDFTTRSWSTRVARAAGMPMEVLPEISDGVIGSVGVNDLGMPGPRASGCWVEWARRRAPPSARQDQRCRMAWVRRDRVVRVQLDRDTCIWERPGGMPRFLRTASGPTGLALFTRSRFLVGGRWLSRRSCRREGRRSGHESGSWVGRLPRKLMRCSCSAERRTSARRAHSRKRKTSARRAHSRA
ncbi:hypothetical protein F7233_01935 [Corynebacterium sp. 321]|nr:hypothetical protein F7233_01935 [Corynebacterium sp. 321]